MLTWGLRPRLYAVARSAGFMLSPASRALPLERKLQLVTNHAAAAVRELRMQELSRCRSKHVRRHPGTPRREWTHARRPVLRMIEDVIKLRPQLNKTCFTNMNSLQQVKVPVVL